jgi:hypothetical protein
MAKASLHGGANVMMKQGAQNYCGRGRVRSVYSAIVFTLLLCTTSEGFSDPLAPLTVERPPKQTVVLTQGFSTTIHSERPFGKIYITSCMTNRSVTPILLTVEERVEPEALAKTARVLRREWC